MNRIGSATGTCCLRWPYFSNRLEGMTFTEFTTVAWTMHGASRVRLGTRCRGSRLWAGRDDQKKGWMFPTLDWGLTLIKQVMISACLVVSTAGCQVAQLQEKQTVPEKDVFARLWSLYRQCRASDDLETILWSAELLVRGSLAEAEPSIGLPPLLSQFIAKPPVRIAADPKAMAADCTLLGARVAVETGQVARARELFRFVRKAYAKPDYAYYAAQAERGLAELSQVSKTSSARTHPDLSEAKRSIKVTKRGEMAASCNRRYAREY